MNSDLRMSYSKLINEIRGLNTSRAPTHRSINDSYRSSSSHCKGTNLLLNSGRYININKSVKGDDKIQEAISSLLKQCNSSTYFSQIWKDDRKYNIGKGTKLKAQFLQMKHLLNKTNYANIFNNSQSKATFVKKNSQRFSNYLNENNGIEAYSNEFKKGIEECSKQTDIKLYPRLLSMGVSLQKKAMKPSSSCVNLGARISMSVLNNCNKNNNKRLSKHNTFRS